MSNEIILPGPIYVNPEQVKEISADPQSPSASIVQFFPIIGKWNLTLRIDIDPDLFKQLLSEVKN